MLESEEQVYRKIYEMTSDRKKAAGGSFCASEDNFIRYSQSEPDRVNLGAYFDLSLDDFSDNLFMLVLRREEDEDSRLRFEEIAENLDEEAYREVIARTVTQTPERPIKQIRLYNEAYGIINQKDSFGKRIGRLRNKIINSASKHKRFQNVLDFLYFKVYLKLPNGLKKWIKKVRSKIARA